MARTTKEQQEALTRLKEAAEGLTESYLQCRDIGHVWRPISIGDDASTSPQPGWRRALRCDPRHGGCGAERHEIIQFDGSIDKRNYRYPEGYLLPGIGIQGGIPRHHFRLAYYNRLYGKK